MKLRRGFTVKVCKGYSMATFVLGVVCAHLCVHVCYRSKLSLGGDEGRKEGGRAKFWLSISCARARGRNVLVLFCSFSQSIYRAVTKFLCSSYLHLAASLARLRPRHQDLQHITLFIATKLVKDINLW